MPSPSTRLGLNIFSGGDTFSTSQYDANWNIIDGAPGKTVCTSSTRPVWGTNQTGMEIVETDTSLTWYWTGTAFIRKHPRGLLNRVTRTTNVGTTSTWQPPGTGTLTTALTTTVAPPNGGRYLMIIAEIPEVTNPNGLSYLVLERDSTILTAWPVWTGQEEGTGNSTLPGSKADYITFDIPGEVSAVYTLAFAASVTLGGTATILGSAGRPAALAVIEI